MPCKVSEQLKIALKKVTCCSKRENANNFKDFRTNIAMNLVN